MKRYLLFLLLVVPLFVTPQSLSVASFALNERDLDAVNEAIKKGMLK